MKKRLATTYAIFCTLLLAAGVLLVFFFAWEAGTRQSIECLCGIVASFILTPFLHEAGHLLFGQAMNMECVYSKFFCFKIYIDKGKKRIGFASPFAAEQTQMLPKKGGNMRSRAKLYVVGGLVYTAAYLAVLLVLGLTLENFVAWGSLPYTAYLFLLNVMPLEYASGKTDVLVLRGIRKGYAAEKCMLAAMEIQGQLYEGKTFDEIDRELYFDLPQLMEEEPLFAILLDLRYRYYLDREELEGAADCLNRLAASQEYLPDSEAEKLAGELVYMHALRGDLESAETCGKLCKEYLAGDSVSAKRILAAYSFAAGKAEAVEPLKEQAAIALNYERIAGVRKFEEKLLERIKS